MNEQYDIIIIGAGPAGSFLANKLEHNVGKVLVIDKRIAGDNLVVEKEKPCSGLVAVPAQAFFSNIMNQGRENILAHPERLRVRVVDVKRRKYVLQKDIVYNINRKAMENALLSEIPDFIDVLRGGTFLNYKERPDGNIEVAVKINHEIKTCLTSILIGADGANSRIRKSITPEHTDAIEKYTGVEWFVKCEEKDKIPPFFNILLDAELTDYYLWAFPKNGRLLMGGVFKRPGNLQEIPSLLLNHLKNLDILHSSNIEIEKVWAHPILRPSGTAHLYCGNRKNIFLIGEAAGFISPASAEGYSYAFSSAQNLSAFLNGRKRTACDYKNVFRIMEKVFIKNLIYNSFFRGIYLSLVGKSY